MAIKISRNRLDMGSTPIKAIDRLELNQITTPADPGTAKTTLYSKSGGKIYNLPTGGSETEVGVAANVIAYFNGAVASIPTGWTEFTAARGRVIVGVPLSGTVGGTVGTALTNVEDRTHTHTGPSHSHTGPSHTHTGPSHTHTIPTVAIGYAVSSFARADTTTNASGTGATGADGTGATGADGTGATGTAATSNVMAYIQQPAIVKS